MRTLISDSLSIPGMLRSILTQVKKCLNSPSSLICLIFVTTLILNLNSIELKNSDDLKKVLIKSESADSVKSHLPYNPALLKWQKQTKSKNITEIKPEMKNLSDLSPNMDKVIDRINVKDMDLKDVLRGLAHQYEINLAVDNNVKKQVTLTFRNIKVHDFIEFIIDEYDLMQIIKGNVLCISEKQIQPIIIKEEELNVQVKDNKLSLDLKNKDIQEVTKKISQLSSKNIILQNGISGPISGYFSNVALDDGIKILFENNGYKVRKKENITYVDIDKVNIQGKEALKKNTWITVDDNKISFELENADLVNVIKELSRQLETNIVLYGEPTGKITAKCNGLSVEETLNYFFKGTDFTYKKEGDIFIIGDKKNASLVTSKLIKLKHIRSEGIADILPDNIKRTTTIEIIKEQNAVMVVGTNDLISEIENYLSKIDFPTPQILIEALVVDFNTTDISELGMMIGSKSIQPDSVKWSNYNFLDLGIDSKGRFYSQTDGVKANEVLKDISSWAGVSNLGKLPSNFYMKIQALENQGKANVRSRPQIATLNGHSASISIGTTQYYILKTVTPVTSAQSTVTQESERFEKVEANVTLSIVPWVSASGDVTVEINPEFKTPVGSFTSSTPPTINSRVLKSTVRLKDGETIILGGLIQDSESKNYFKVPILGDLPFIGRLFSTRNKNKSKSELMIYITPHVFYGDNGEIEKWDNIRKTYDFMEKK